MVMSYLYLKVTSSKKISKRVLDTDFECPTLK
jgi:hypothetical protein